MKSSEEKALAAQEELKSEFLTLQSKLHAKDDEISEKVPVDYT